jgi:hypothetical protein
VHAYPFSKEESVFLFVPWVLGFLTGKTQNLGLESLVTEPVEETISVKRNNDQIDQDPENPWTEPDVRQLHALFDSEAKKAQSAEEGEELLHRFFGPGGLVDQKLAVWRGKDADIATVLKVAFELYTFKFFVFTCFFLNEYSDDLVRQWREQDEAQREKAEASDGPVAHIRQEFDAKLAACQSIFDLEGLKALYLSPTGVLAQEFTKARKLDDRAQVAIGAALFHLRSYIEYMLFEADFSTKSSMWTVPVVRAMVYDFEEALKSSTSEEDFRTIQQRYHQDTGCVAVALRSMREHPETLNAVYENELVRLQETIQSFFSTADTRQKG